MAGGFQSAQDQQGVPLNQARLVRLKSKVVALTDATATTAIAAPGAGKRVVLVSVIVDGTTAAGTLAIKDGAGGTILFQAQSPTAATTYQWSFPSGMGISFSINTLVELVGKAGTTQSICLYYYIDNVAPTA